MSKDYYKTLGIDKSASEEDVKKAFRKLAHQHHPDKSGGNVGKFKEINEAYQVISDKEKRAQYDRFGSNFSAGGGPASGWDFSNMGDLNDIGDIFETFFGGGRSQRGGRSRTASRHGADVEIAKEIVLEEAFRGDTMTLRYETFGTCTECKGLGSFKEVGSVKCSVCNGQGEIRETRRSFFGQFSQVRECATCKGKGEIPNKICKHCNGSGRVKNNKEIQVAIIQGIADGQVIKVAGAGQAGEHGAPAGDLYVHIKVRPHHLFKRVGDDLIIRKDLDILKVLAGNKIEVPTVQGGKINIEIPVGFNLRERMRISKEGMPHLGHYAPFGSAQGRRGDLYVEFDVKVPKVKPEVKKVLGE